MKPHLTLLFISILISVVSLAQPAKKPKQTAAPNMDKMMQDAMKGMSNEEQAEMQKLMKGIMPTLTDKTAKTADYADFNRNEELVPKRDMVRIATISKKRLTQADIATYAANLYAKLMAKGEAAENTLVKSVIAKAQKANDISNGAVLAMMQGHQQAAMALSMKALQLDPANVNMQNNMAAMLTQYGYPEQALPVLNKLKNEFPVNSTVLNNLCLAWFSLGELDSAKKFARLTMRVNPYHPETTVCGGLMEELNGDPIKAGKDYTAAMENNPNSLIEKIAKNKMGDKGFEKIDFDKIKRSITIYEYFPKDWIKIPALSDHVSEYENDRKIQNGHSKMFTELKEKIETLLEASNAEASNLAEKNQDDFIKEMGLASVKGYNVMSKTAVTVQMILQQYIAKWNEDNVKEYAELQNEIDAKRAVMTKTGEHDKCADFDRKNNEFLAYINPVIRKFHAKKIEEFRSWLNAYCTWSWYTAGNPKNTIMTSCIAWTAALETLYENAINDQQVIAKSCVAQNGDQAVFVPTPEIPNFSCPTLLKVPIGKDWQELSNATKNFDTNSLGITSKSNPIPNQTLAFGGDNKSIAQPGVAPFVKTTNGSVTPGMINDSDDDLAPLSVIPLDELTPLPNLPDNDLTPLPDLRKSRLLKDLLNKMTTADCNNVKSPKDKLNEQLDRMMKSVKEMDAYGELHEKIKDFDHAVKEMDATMAQKEQLKKQIEKIQQEADKMDKYETMQQSKKEIEKIMKEIDAMDAKKALKEKQVKIQQLVDEMDNALPVLQNIKQNGLQPSISNGIQTPGTITPIKGLFQ
ncbi:hypothetical protein [Pedobacter foliorum]|uniref:hypothetical protein n=1 Tax=Pedobacter foliorum TaxID=2739058 RepID=UPI00156551AE|nr:hypothetical protein [Pedobacter foliorum]NRF40080.1 hypothetical protein [Pedobacter foliorum]